MADDDEEVIVKEGSVWKQGRGMISKSWAERYLIVGAEVGLSLAALPSCHQPPTSLYLW